MCHCNCRLQLLFAHSYLDQIVCSGFVEVPVSQSLSIYIMAFSTLRRMAFRQDDGSDTESWHMASDDDDRRDGLGRPFTSSGPSASARGLGVGRSSDAPIVPVAVAPAVVPATVVPHAAPIRPRPLPAPPAAKAKAKAKAKALPIRPRVVRGRVPSWVEKHPSHYRESPRHCVWELKSIPPPPFSPTFETDLFECYVNYSATMKTLNDCSKTAAKKEFLGVRTLMREKGWKIHKIIGSPWIAWMSVEGAKSCQRASKKRLEGIIRSRLRQREREADEASAPVP